jgi:hypothetical protein
MDRFIKTTPVLDIVSGASFLKKVKRNRRVKNTPAPTPKLAETLNKIGETPMIRISEADYTNVVWPAFLRKRDSHVKYYGLTMLKVRSMGGSGEVSQLIFKNVHHKGLRPRVVGVDQFRFDIDRRRLLNAICEAIEKLASPVWRKFEL